jgi:uncharacterized protein (DUF924 family)
MSAGPAQLKTPHDVLSFWFTERAYYGDRERLSDPAYMEEMSDTLWYVGTSADESCMQFVDTIQAAADGMQGEATLLDAMPEWQNADAEPDASIAKVLLFDQLSRNCFRATDKAFAYDGLALELARKLAQDAALVASLPGAHRFVTRSPVCSSLVIRVFVTRVLVIRVLVTHALVHSSLFIDSSCIDSSVRSTTR